MDKSWKRPSGFGKQLTTWIPLLGGLALVAAACGGESDPEPTPTPTATAEPELPEVIDGEIMVVTAGGDFAVGDGAHFPFVTLSLGGETLDVNNAVARFFADALDNPTEVARVAAIKSSPGVDIATDHLHANGVTHKHGEGAISKGVFYADIDFDRPGVWGLVVNGTLDDGTEVMGQMSFEVFENASFPAPGDAAKASDNLTRFDVEDISTIDSGTVPNDMHDVKIKDAIAAGRPFVVVFATPAFCTTRFCGPVTEEVETLNDDYSADVDFVHIEIWMDRQASVVNPTALEWLAREDGSFTEPWVYVVDKNGVIFDRWEGPVSRVVMEDAVKAVAAGAVYDGE
jgi:hypothetical protein